MNKKFHYLLSQAAFKVLVPWFVWIPQWVKYAGPAVLRIDDKSNPMAREARAVPPFKQNTVRMRSGDPSLYIYIYIYIYVVDMFLTYPKRWAATHVPWSSSLLHICTLPPPTWICRAYLSSIGLSVAWSSSLDFHGCPIDRNPQWFSHWYVLERDREYPASILCLHRPSSCKDKSSCRKYSWQSTYTDARDVLKS
jgi:hypothetical protein